jgi:hypothetical protein
MNSGDGDAAMDAALPLEEEEVEAAAAAEVARV